MNNRVWYYAVGKGKTVLVTEREYLGTVSRVALSDKIAAVLSEGRIMLHAIDPKDGA